MYTSFRSLAVHMERQRGQRQALGILNWELTVSVNVYRIQAICGRSVAQLNYSLSDCNVP